MTKPELIQAVKLLAEQSKSVDIGAAVVLFTLAGSLDFYGTAALQNVCVKFAEESLQRIQQLKNEP